MTNTSAQAGFALALIDPRRAAPQGLTTWNGSDPAQRFAVHRNNAVVSLVDALAARFPVVAELVGEAFFRAMARLFVLDHPPRSRILTCYGDDFPIFIDRFAPAESVPYLGDVARLEAARGRAYHAADAPALGADDFARFPAGVLERTRLAQHPSAEILTSRFAIFSLWAAHQGALDIGQVDPAGPEDILIVRPGQDVEVTRLGPGAAMFLEALRAGMCLGRAAEIVAGIVPGFDLTAALHVVIASGVATSLTMDDGGPA